MEMELDWAKLVRHLSERCPGIRVKVPKDRLTDPLKAGFRKSVGLHLRRKHYRMALPDGRCVHVEETKDAYIIHVDGKDPGVSPIGHLREDAPGLWTALTTGVGLSAGLVAGLRDDEHRALATAAGTIIGLLIGILTGKWGRK